VAVGNALRLSANPSLAGNMRDLSFLDRILVAVAGVLAVVVLVAVLVFDIQRTATSGPRPTARGIDQPQLGAGFLSVYH
jgi:hypothetical protein